MAVKLSISKLFESFSSEPGKKRKKKGAEESATPFFNREPEKVPMKKDAEGPYYCTGRSHFGPPVEVDHEGTMCQRCWSEIGWDRPRESTDRIRRQTSKGNAAWNKWFRENIQDGDEIKSEGDDALPYVSLGKNETTAKRIQWAALKEKRQLESGKSVEEVYGDRM